MFPISRLSNFFLPTILVSTKALGGGRCGWLSIGCLADIKCTQTDHRSAKGRFPKSITSTTISPSLSASSSASSSPSWLQNSTTATELSPLIFLCLFSPSILGERLLKRHCQEGLPGGATSDNSAAADDFVMIANDLLHSAAKSCSKDVVSIGMGQLEDGLCDAASGKTYANNIIRKRIQKTASPGGHWMKRAWHDLLWFISVGHWSALYKHLADAKDAQDKGGYGFNLCQPPNGLDLSRLVPGSCCLEGAPGPKAKVHRRSNWLVRWWVRCFFFPGVRMGWGKPECRRKVGFLMFFERLEWSSGKVPEVDGVGCVWGRVPDSFRAAVKVPSRVSGSRERSLCGEGRRKVSGKGFWRLGVERVRLISRCFQDSVRAVGAKIVIHIIITVISTNILIILM